MFLKTASRNPRIDILKAVSWAFLAMLSLYYIALIAYCYGGFDFSRVAGVLGDPEIKFALRLSLLSSAAATAIAMAIALPAAWCLSRYAGRPGMILDAIIDIPILLSPIATGALLLIFFSGDIGRMLDGKGAGVVFNFRGVVTAQFTIVTALAVRLLKSTFDDIDPRYERLARSLGCGSVGAFTRAVLPLARNGIAAAAVLVWARSMGEFGATIMLAGSTAMKTETLPVSIYLSFASADINRALTVTGLLLSVSLITLFGIKIFSGSRSVR